jgi:hypothetical protein
MALEVMMSWVDEEARKVGLTVVVDGGDCCG